MIHPNTIKVREDIWNFANAIDENVMNEHSQPNKWTIAQVLEHLYLMETAITARLRLKVAENNPAPSSMPSTPFHLTLDRNRHTPAPAALVPADKHCTLIELQTRLIRSRELFVELIESIDPVMLENRTMDHPIFGPLTLQEWTEFIGLHEQRHLEQMKEIEAELSQYH
ncbi:DinB family protein [Paenibacillus sp. PsM32]|uniref:DinB family protein n=1 Tax=Paenibacillus sp. PsM32 TaxID=3030536 RepID=UPI00263AA28E|nr:DinB family protein [Paenibacillus sp. PsM32]MDN4617069.1 DinB family protein [Paenibacillus sp. PsM32]